MNSLFDCASGLGQALVVDRPGAAISRCFAKLIEDELIEIVGHNL